MIFILRILRISFVRFTRILPRLAVVDVRDDGHRADVPRLRLDLLQLGEGEVDLRGGGSPVREVSASPRTAGARQLQYESRWEQGGRLRVLCCSRGADAALVATAARPHEANGASTGAGGGVPS